MMNQAHHKPKVFHHLHEYGFTIMESLITTLLMTVLFFLAQQTYRNFQLTIYNETIQQTLTLQLKMAKNLASIKKRAITLCGSFDGKSCIQAEDYKWRGWLLFFDEDATFIADQTEILYYQAPSSLYEKGFYLQTTTNIGGGINFRVHREYAYGMARSLPNGRIKLCYRENNLRSLKEPSHYTFVINVYGYFRIVKEKGAC